MKMLKSATERKLRSLCAKFSLFCDLLRSVALCCANFELRLIYLYFRSVELRSVALILRSCHVFLEKRKWAQKHHKTGNFGVLRSAEIFWKTWFRVSAWAVRRNLLANFSGGF